MLYDRFLKLVEHDRPLGLWPPDTALVDTARLFLFEEPVWGCRESYDLRLLTDVEELRDHFRLPFRTVAVELSTLQTQPGEWQSCILMRDLDKEAEGLTAERQCVVSMDMEGDEHFGRAADYGPGIENAKFIHLITVRGVDLSSLADGGGEMPTVQ